MKENNILLNQTLGTRVMSKIRDIFQKGVTNHPRYPDFYFHLFLVIFFTFHDETFKLKSLKSQCIKNYPGTVH
jgi:hypothetical protein